MNLEVPVTNHRSSAWRYFDKKTANELHVRFAEFCRQLDIPLDFKTNFPYLFAVIQDQYMVNVVNSRNIDKLKIKYKALFNINYDFATIILYQHQIIKEMSEYLDKRKSDESFRTFVDNIDNLKKILISDGLKEKSFNEIVENTIKIAPLFKPRK